MSFFKKRKTSAIKRIHTSNLSLSAGIVISLFIAFLFILGVFKGLESSSLDLRMKLRGPLVVVPASQIIGIDDTSLAAFGRWPWSRSYLGHFLDLLSPYEPRAVVFDMIFPEPTEEGPDEDQAFAQGLDKNGRSVLGMFFRAFEKGQDRSSQRTESSEKVKDFMLAPAGGNYSFWHQGGEPTLTISLLSDAAQGIGYVNVTPDPDGKMRRIHLVLHFDGRIYPSLALKAVMTYWGLTPEDIRLEPGRWIEIRKKDGESVRIPVDRRGFTTINYPGSVMTYRPMSFAQLMAVFYDQPGSEARKPEVAERLKGSIAFIGVTATASTDLISTPYVSLEPGISLQAALVNSILTGRFLYPAPLFLNLLILLAAGALVGWLIPRLGPSLGFFSFLGLMTVYPVIAHFLFVRSGVIVPIVSPLFVGAISYLAVVFIQFIGERFDKQALEQELAIAQRIQRSFLPKTVPETPAALFAAETVMAKSVGGDLYDFVTFEDGTIGVTIGDVSGKGVPAALYMAKTISDFRTNAKLERRPAPVIIKLNGTLVQEGASGMFVTLFYLLLDPVKKSLIFSSAGHHPLLRWEKATGTITEHNTKKGRPLGILPMKALDEGELSLASGDLLILYTDGIDEAMNRARQTFGKERIERTLQENCDKTPQEIIQALHKAVQAHAGTAPQHDYMTLVVIRIN